MGFRGFKQRPDIDYDETFSPVMKPMIVCTVMSLALLWDCPVHQLDVKNAFLYGILTETVTAHNPLDSLTLLSLTSFRAWYNRFASYLLSLGFVEAKSDTCLFISH
jgi:hypothetical protein